MRSDYRIRAQILSATRKAGRLVSRLSRLGFIDARRTTDPVRRRVRSRGVPPALDGREIFYTEDPGEASELVGKALAPNRLTLGQVGANEFAASMHGVRFREVSLLYLDLHVAATLDIPRCGRYYAVHMPMNGRAVGTVGGRQFEANTIRALVTNPADELNIRFDHDSPQLIVRIEQDALERYLTRLSGRMMTQGLDFEPSLDLTSDAATRWHGSVQLLHTEVFYKGSLVHDGIGIGPLEEFLMSSLLMIQPSTYREQLIRAVPAPGRRAVRQALDFMEQHLSEPLTMTDIAAHVGVSVRSIQQGFRDEIGVTPMAWLRDRRLERVREELTDADTGDGVTVTAVAQRWGFTHLGTFAALYRKRWGESPSQTLQR
jgi:AraC-like DNA-binding protein